MLPFTETYEDGRSAEAQSINISTEDDEALENLSQKKNLSKDVPEKRAVRRPHRYNESDDSESGKQCSAHEIPLQ